MMKQIHGEPKRGALSAKCALLFGAGVAIVSPMRAKAQDFVCEANSKESLACSVARSGAVVCTAPTKSVAIDLDGLAGCVDRRLGIGANPIVTIAAFGSASDPTDVHSGWNGGTALTTRKLEALTDDLDGDPLYVEVAYPLLGPTAVVPNPGQATLVTTRRLRSPQDVSEIGSDEALLVAGGGGAHGMVIAQDATEDVKRGGFGGYADGWAGVPCPYTEGVCAPGMDGGSAEGAPGGAGGVQDRTPDFVSARPNGEVDSFADRLAFGGHGGAGHPHGGGGQARERLRSMSAGGGGGGGSFARRSTRPTPENLQSVLLREPGFQVIFQRDGLHSQVEWQYAQFSSERIDSYPLKGIEGQTRVSVTVIDPGAPETDLELGGLILVEGCGRDGRRVEPYKVTDLMNLGTGFTTTDQSLVYYRVYDGEGALIATGETEAAAAFVVDTTFDLFFRYTDRVGNRGKVSIFSDSGRAGSAPSNRLCPS